MKINVKRIRYELKENGKNVDWLAKKMKHSRSWAFYVLSHPENTSFRTIDKLAKALDVNPKDLLIE